MALITLYMLLILIFWEDLKERSVHWFLFPLLFIGGLWFRDFQINWEDLGMNLLFLCVLFGGLTVYLSLKLGKLVAITKAHFGWGDILFLLAITPFFSFFNFVLLFTFGTIAVLLIHVIVSLFVSGPKSIPFAGYFALLTGLELTFSMSDHLNHLLV